ncbi:MAG: Zn-ribbon domain-containing OB-fold protein [Thermodesulfobacteriota bacterium]
MGYEKEKGAETMGLQGSWNIGAYKYKAPRLLEEYVQALKERRLIGSVCPGCGKVIVPLRNICGRCHMKMSKRMEVSDKGTITCFTYSPPVAKGKYKVLGADPVETGLLHEGEILMPVFVRFDGSDSNVHTLLVGSSPEEVHVGMRVQAIWAKDPQGALGDLEGVEPLKAMSAVSTPKTTKKASKKKTVKKTRSKRG